MNHSTVVQRYIFATLFAGIPFASRAAHTPWAVQRAESGLFLGIGEDILHTQESVAGNLIDSEDGGLPTYTLGLAHLGSRAGSPYWRVQLSGALGTTRYHGNTALGLPTQRSSTNRIISLDGRLGLTMDGLWGGGRALVLIPYLGMGFQRWTRGVVSGHAYTGGETMTEGHLGLGLGADDALDRRWVLSLHAFGGYTVGAQRTATVPTFFNTATNTLENTRVSETLGDRPYEVLGGAISYRADRRLDISLRVRRATWSATGSSPIPILDSSGGTVGASPVPSSRSTDTAILIEARSLF